MTPMTPRRESRGPAEADCRAGACRRAQRSGEPRCPAGAHVDACDRRARSERAVATEVTRQAPSPWVEESRNLATSSTWERWSRRSSRPTPSRRLRMPSTTTRTAPRCRAGTAHAPPALAETDRRNWNPTLPVTGRHVLPLGGPAVGAADRDRRLWLFGAVTVVLLLRRAPRRAAGDADDPARRLHHPEVDARRCTPAHHRRRTASGGNAGSGDHSGDPRSAHAATAHQRQDARHGQQRLLRRRRALRRASQ